MENRICKKCGEEFPLDEVHFFRTKNGFEHRCKVCRGRSFVNKKITINNGFKACTKCKKELPATTEHFTKKNSSPLGLNSICKDCNRERRNENARKFRQRHKDLVSENNKKYREINREKLNAEHKKYYQENKQKILHQSKRYYQENKEKIVQKNAQYAKLNRHVNNKAKAKYNKTENGRILINRKNHKRRTDKKLPFSFSINDWHNCKKSFENKCAYCGEVKKLTQEHFIPLDRGGEYTINNIIPCCKTCNSSKRNVDFFEWYPKQPFYSKEREKKILKYLNYKNNTQQLALL